MIKNEINLETDSQQETDKTFSLEDAFRTLDGMIEKLQDKEITLHEAVELYQKGMQLCGKCSDSIDLAEKKVIQLQGEEDSLAF